MHKHKNKIHFTGAQDENIVIENRDGFSLDWNKIESNVTEQGGTYRRRRRRKQENKSDMTVMESSLSTNDNYLDKQNRRRYLYKKPAKKMSTPKKIIIGITIFLSCLIVGILSAFLILRYNGYKELFTDDITRINTIDNATTENNGHTVIYNGKTYTFNPYVTSILFMGIDKTELGTEVYGTGGQADAIYLLTYDISSGDTKVIAFSRDTMADINLYAANGDYVKTTNTQLCLSYAYGDGKELSARNTVISMQRILYNIPIKSYFAIDLSAMKTLNDDIGGVTLTSLLTRDNLVEGKTYTLLENDVEAYIRARDINILDSNVKRMERQKQYITAYANQIVPAIQKNFSLPFTLYNHIKDYSVTNLTPSKIAYLASQISTGYNGLEFISIPGKITANKKDGKAQFYPDQTALYEIILNTFYTCED